MGPTWRIIVRDQREWMASNLERTGGNAETPPASHLAPQCSLLHMAVNAGWYPSQLRLELMERNRLWARNHAHVESYGSSPVIVYAPDGGRHGNFFDPAYCAILARTEWMRRFDKIHAQAARSLPKPQFDPTRK